jgi:hypothetical protein
MEYFIVIYLIGCFANIVVSIEIFEAVSFFHYHESFTVPISLVVPTIVTEVNCLEFFLKSLELSTLFPRESIIVASGTLENLSQIKKLKELIQNALIPNLKLILKHDGLLLQSTSRNIGAK